MQKTFKAVRQGDIEAVRKILQEKPEEIKAVAKQPPKKDDGQSLLQVALKTGQLQIADMLLDFGADVNFMESEDCCNEWRMPVLHDAVMCAVMNSRWNVKDHFENTYRMMSTKEDADKAYEILERILSLGADINARDSFGNSVLDRALIDAAQILPPFDWSNRTVWSDDRKLTEELKYDLNRIFSLLYKYGASNQWTDKNSGKTLPEEWEGHPAAQFLTPTEPQPKKKGLLGKLFG